jgi:hypothetical protein
MNVYDFAAARAIRPARVATPEDNTANFGKVYEIETARRARGARIPDSVMEEMAAADALFEDLQEQGRQIRFTQFGGRVVATLCELDGTIVRPIGLREVVGMEDVDPETAA